MPERRAVEPEVGSEHFLTCLEAGYEYFLLPPEAELVGEPAEAVVLVGESVVEEVSVGEPAEAVVRPFAAPAPNAGVRNAKEEVTMNDWVPPLTPLTEAMTSEMSKRLPGGINRTDVFFSFAAPFFGGPCYFWNAPVIHSERLEQSALAASASVA